jgi:hypothetical protein
VTTGGDPAVGPGEIDSVARFSLNSRAPTGAAYSVLQVIPRPARANPLVVERLVVADDTPVDRGDARGLERPRPFEQYGIRASRARIDRGIAVAADDQISVQHAIANRSAGLQRRGEPVIPSESVRVAASVRIFMFDAGIIILSAFNSKSRSLVSSERMSTPQTPRPVIRAPKTRERSACSSRTARDRGGRPVRRGAGAIRTRRREHARECDHTRPARSKSYFSPRAL